jgi:hypothetical protein
VPSRDGSESFSSVILQNSAVGTQLAGRLSKVFKTQVFIGGDIGDEQEKLWRLVESRIKEESLINPAMFSF